MSVKVTLSNPSDRMPANGTAGLKTQIGGSPTTVSGIMEAGEATGNAGIIKKAIG